MYEGVQYISRQLIGVQAVVQHQIYANAVYDNTIVQYVQNPTKNYGVQQNAGSCEDDA